MSALLPLSFPLSTDFGNANSSTQAPAEACVAHMRIRAFLIIAAVLAFPLQGTRTRTGTFGKTAIAAPRARSKGEERIKQEQIWH